MGEPARELVDGGHDDAGAIGEPLAWRTRIRGGAPAVWLKLSRCGAMADHANGKVGEGGEDVKLAPNLHAPNLLLPGEEPVGEGDEVRKEYDLKRQVNLKADAMLKVA
eukprot:4340062-Pleurochrysis_carterae.AAC.1